MSETLNQHSLDVSKILALGEGRLVNASPKGYFASSLVGKLPVKAESVLAASLNSDLESAWITHDEAVYAAEAWAEEDTDIVTSISTHRRQATMELIGQSLVDPSSFIC